MLFVLNGAFVCYVTQHYPSGGAVTLHITRTRYSTHHFINILYANIDFKTFT